jgi:hypothetical protein
VHVPDFGPREPAAPIPERILGDRDAIIERARIVEEERPAIAAPAVDVQHCRVLAHCAER